ncbi:hypothetical protein NFI96_008335, partial [Prochilodus magdalenae]
FQAQPQVHPLQLQMSGNSTLPAIRRPWSSDFSSTTLPHDRRVACGGHDMMVWVGTVRFEESRGTYRCVFAPATAAMVTSTPFLPMLLAFLRLAACSFPEEPGPLISAPAEVARRYPVFLGRAHRSYTRQEPLYIQTVLKVNRTLYIGASSSDNGTPNSTPGDLRSVYACVQEAGRGLIHCQADPPAG